MDKRGKTRTNLDDHGRAWTNTNEHKRSLGFMMHLSSIREKFFNAAVYFAIFYGRESWTGVSLESIDMMNISAVRRLLNVRQSTPKVTGHLKL